VETVEQAEVEMVLLLVQLQELVELEGTLVVLVLLLLEVEVLLEHVKGVTLEQTLEEAVVHLEDLILRLEMAVLE
jgi:hypothetical protein